MANTANVIHFSEAKSARNHKLQVSLSPVVKEGPGQYGLITLDSDAQTVEFIMSVLSNPDFAAQGTPRTGPEVREFANLTRRRSYWTVIGNSKVYYNYSFHEYCVEIESICGGNAGPDGSSLPFDSQTVLISLDRSLNRSARQPKRMTTPRYVATAALISLFLLVANGFLVGSFLSFVFPAGRSDPTTTTERVSRGDRLAIKLQSNEGKSSESLVSRLFFDGTFAQFPDAMTMAGRVDARVTTEDPSHRTQSKPSVDWTSSSSTEAVHDMQAIANSRRDMQPVVISAATPIITSTLRDSRMRVPVAMTSAWFAESR
jgi:hypothetical protein